jgi:hypothetical protein
MNKQGIPFNWHPNKFLQTLLSDGIIACMPIAIPHAIKTWPAPLSLIIVWTLQDIVCKRLSSRGAMRFKICLAVVVAAVVFASIVWGHTGDVPNIRVLYIVLVSLIAVTHATVTAKNAVHNTLQPSSRDNQ